VCSRRPDSQLEIFFWGDEDWVGGDVYMGLSGACSTAQGVAQIGISALTTRRFVRHRDAVGAFRTNGTQSRCMTLAARDSLLSSPRVGINAFDELGRVGVRPIRMQLLQLRTDLLSGRLDRNALTLEGESLRSDGGDQLPFRGDE
jgi:hypothetical protein